MALDCHVITSVGFLDLQPVWTHGNIMSIYYYTQEKDMAIHRRSESVQSTITETELKKLKRAADKAHMTVSDWIRLRIQIGLDTRVK